MGRSSFRTTMVVVAKVSSGDDGELSEDCVTTWLLQAQTTSIVMRLGTR